MPPSSPCVSRPSEGLAFGAVGALGGVSAGTGSPVADLGDELEDVDAFMAWVEARHPGEPEFHQAVRGVATHVIDLARDTPGFAEYRILQRLTEPDRMISFRVVWEDDQGRVRINRGYRVQHSNAIGPYKGGLRFDPGVCPSVLKFLAFEQTFKNSLTGLNLGAGKGGADLDPKGKSDRDLMRFCHAYMTELARHIGYQTDVPAGDIGVGSREIGYLFGQYKRLENEFSGSLTGKPLQFGGSVLREEATGFGAIYFLCALLEDAGADLEDQRLAVSGAGNVAIHVALKAIEMGARVITLSNRDGYLRAADGLSREAVCRVRRLRAEQHDMDEIAAAVGAEFVPDEKPWGEDCDVAVPSATENELDEPDARNLVDGGCRLVVEAANMPLTESARRVLKEADAKIAPGKAANAGGVAVSGFEMAQNRAGRSWTRERLDQELRELMGTIYARVRDAGQTDAGIDLCRGADRAGFMRVARSLLAFGAV